MSNTWLIIANASNAYFYELDHDAYDNNKIIIDLIAEHSHPASRSKDGELISDRAGHYYTGDKGHGSYNNPTDAKANEADKFAKELADKLELARVKNKFDNLVLITPAQFQGLFNKHSNKNLNAKITLKFDKDYTKTPKLELLNLLKQHLQ